MRLILFLIFVGMQMAVAQTSPTRAELEAKRAQINNQIQKTNQQLQKTQATRKMTAKELSSLQKKLKGREQVIQTVAVEVAELDANIARKAQIVAALQTDLDKLKTSYNQILRMLYRYKVQQSPLLFFLSAPYFTQMQQRWQFLRQLENRQHLQMKNIRATKASLDKNLAFLQVEKAKKDQLLSGEMKEKTILGQEIKSKDKLATTLKQKENKLRGDLAQKEKSRQQLSSKIESVIRNVIAGQKQDVFTYQGATAAKGSTTNTTVKIDEKNLGTAFAARKGRLPYPAAGSIYTAFGKSVHPQFPEVFIMNNGIDIQTKANAAVQAIYDGVVVSTFAIPGNGNAVMLRHGDYYTTYSNLSTVNVKRGDKVAAKTKLGSVTKDAASGKYLLHFELWKGKAKENPSAWLGN